MKVKKGMLIQDIIQANSDSIEIMARHGLHCIGCQVSTFESLEDGCRAHGMDDKEIKEIVDEINGASVEDSLTLTKVAFEEMKKVIKESNGIRVWSKDDGFEASLVDNHEADDIVLDAPGVRVFIEKKSVPKLKGKKLDFKEGKFYVR
ncbi:MAG: DUF1858 domain-containing protein [Candidatus Woesearchaeota archaeon]